MADSFVSAIQIDCSRVFALPCRPCGNLLSTFAGLTAMADLKYLATIDAAAARRYVESLQLPKGGFRGAAWDDRADLEYTFYGLGTLALLEGQFV